MANPIFSKLQTSPGDPPETDANAHQNRDSFISESLKLIRRVIVGRRSVPVDEIPDVAQNAALRLWQWRLKFADKSSQMAASDWNSFTARTVHNEVNRNLSRRDRLVSVPLDEIDLSDDRSIDSSAEVIQLVELLWQGICSLSLYQRQALLFNSIDLVIYLLQLGVEEDLLLEQLALSRQSWKLLSARMPLSDAEIAETVSLSLRKRSTANSVKKARFDARKRLKELMK